MNHPVVEQSITWVYTEDLEGTSRFYGEVLGLAKVLEQAGENGGGCHIFRHSPTSFMGVCRVRPGRYVEPKGVVISFVVADVDAWHRHLVARGVEPAAAPRESAAYGVYGFFARDPNGYMLEFQSFRGPAWRAATAG